MKTVFVVLLTIFALGCGYTKPMGTTTTHINTLTPTSIAHGGADFMLTVNGTGFTSSTVVYWKAAPRTSAFVSASQVTALISAADIASAGTASVYTLTTGGPYGGTGNQSNSVTFTVN